MKTELSEMFRLITGLRIDVEQMLDEASDKNEIFRHFVWHMPRGTKMYPGTQLGEQIKEFLSKISAYLSINPEESLSEDGFLSNRDKDFLSIIEIEVGPTDEPTEEPTDEPTEEPTEVPIESKPYWALTNKISKLQNVSTLTSEDILGLQLNAIDFEYNEAIAPIEVKNESDETQVLLVLVPNCIEILSVENDSDVEFAYDSIETESLGNETYTIYAVTKVTSEEIVMFGDANENGYAVKFVENA